MGEVNIPALKRNRERDAFYKNLEQEKRKKALAEQALLEQKELEERAIYNKVLEAENNHKNLAYDYANFLESVKLRLLSEAIMQVYGRSIEGRCFVNEGTVKYGVSLVNNYLKENGSYNTIKRMKTVNSILLNDIREAVESTYKEIVESTDKKNAETFKIDDDTINNFYDKLDFDSFQDAADLIKCRVSSATEEFITANKADKEAIETMMQDTKEKIDSASSDMVAKEATLRFTANSEKLRNTRTRNVLEQMIFSASTDIIKDKALLESFTSDNDGKLDMESIIEHVEIQYTVLEMLNTIRLEEFDVNAVKELISK